MELDEHEHHADPSFLMTPVSDHHHHHHGHAAHDDDLEVGGGGGMGVGVGVGAGSKRGYPGVGAIHVMPLEGELLVSASPRWVDGLGWAHGFGIN